MPSTRFRRRATALLPIAVIVSATSGRLAADQPGGAWPAWRGGTAEGRAPGPLPTIWNGTDGIRWKTAIPGRGHSSPIVSGDRIYVTTADATVSGALLQRVLHWLTFALALLLVQGSVRVAVSRCRASRHEAGALLTGGSMVALSIAIVLIAAAGDALLGATSDPTRAWLMGSVVMTLCVSLALFLAGPRGRLAVAAMSVAFGLLCVATFPSKAFVFRSGFRSLREQVAYAIVMLPVLVGCAAALLEAVRASAVRLRRTVLGVAATIAVSAAVVLVRRVIDFRDASVPEMRYEPQLSLWLLAAALVVVATSHLWHHRSPHSRTAAIVVLLGLSTAIVLGAISMVEAIAAQSGYLAYQLGSPSTATPGHQAPVLTGLALLIGSALAARQAEGTAGPRAERLRDASLAAALAIGIVFFVRINYVHTSFETVRGIVSLDRLSGRIVWHLRGLEGPPPRIDGRNSAATPTPVTDGRVVCASFGAPGIMCAATDGRLLWALGPRGEDGRYGVGSSPLLADGLLLVVDDRFDGRVSIDAFDASTGLPRWAHRFTTTPTLSGNSRTPLVLDMNGERVLLLWGMQYLTAVSLRTGTPLWSHPVSSGGDVVSSAVSDPEHLFLSDATGTVALDRTALSAGRAHVMWRNNARSNCVSPVAVNRMLFTVTDSGVASSIDIATGRTLWQRRLPGNYYASLVASPTAVYFTNSEGLTTVAAAEPRFRLVATNELGEDMTASMAAADGEILVRSSRHVFAIGPAVSNHSRR